MKNTFFKKILTTSCLSLIIIFYASVLVVPAVTFAQPTTASSTTGCVSTKDSYCLLEPIVVNGSSQDRVNIATYLGEMFKIGIGLAGIFAVFMIIWGGFEYVSTDAISGKSAGKEKIEGALWGLGLALGSYLILNTINPELLKFSAGPEPVVVKRDLATRVIYKDPTLIEELRIGDEARTNNLSIEALRKRVQSLRDQAFEKGDSEEGRYLTERADKLEKEADGLYVTSVIKLRYDNAANSVLKGNGLANDEIRKMNDFFTKQTSLLINTGAAKNEIDSINAQKIARNAQLEQAQDMYEIQKLLTSNAEKNRGEVVDIVLAFEKESKSIISRLKDLDPNEAQLFKEATNKNIKAINPLIEYRKSCPKDFTTDWGGIGQRIVDGAIKGAVGGAIIGGTAGTFTVPAVGTAVGVVVGGTIGTVGGAISHGLTEIAYGQKIPCQAK